MSYVMSLQEMQRIDENFNKLRRQNESIRLTVQWVRDTLEKEMAIGPIGESTMRECLKSLNSVLGCKDDKMGTAKWATRT